MKTREYLAIKRRIDEFELSESLTREKLIAGARAGSIAALMILRERYGLRFPMIENTLNVTLPWQQTARSFR
jgi:hypothetical protein